jgi:hypothetical protein
MPELRDVSDSEDDDSHSESMPALEEVDNTDDEPPSDTDDEDPAPPPQPSASSQSRAAPKPKITGYFKVETLEERAVRLERENREYAEHAEEARLREVDAKRKIAARKRADATERMQRFRAREREEKIANGWIAGQKRVRDPFVVLVFCRTNSGI